MLSDAARRDPAMSGQYNYERIENEFYPTPVKFVDCLAEHLPLGFIEWWEPCAGKGHIALAVEAITHSRVEVSDLVRYPDHPERIGFGERVVIADFLAQTKAPEGIRGIITNPPYLTINVEGEPGEGEDDWRHLAGLARKYGLKGSKVSLAELFLRHAIALMYPVGGTVAMFLRNEFDCGSKRMDLFQSRAFAMKVICTERPRWIEGSTGSPRHNYSWFVFQSHNRDAPVTRYSHPKSATPITVQ